ncbi:1,2-dihydroxy-3-keto-5-methylthiopentene dioxygenase [Yinghuangia seranimata]|uniref:1,2-dihydroxy-3-keto-5-methylthiopentene dioxygenase n=1 Tax=Yinghuangia seranimata TaxID=408067 RepID=UPI00248C4355|nr:cupin domain-containing protein [Yinghuangia seranimata]MDI2126001.1 cupin domain-containing protein [Yinghuangia seranimata]
MSLLTVWPEADSTTPVLRTADPEGIAEALAPIGVRYERWTADAELAPGATQEQVIEAYRTEVDRITAAEGYILVDVIRLQPSDDPEWPAKAAAARQKFLSEHTHDDDEVRFFVEGAGIFYLHVDGQVYAVLCEAGDLLSVPKGTTHWFDMGAEPSVAAIRFFHDEDGWVGDFTGDPISARFPDFDAIWAGYTESAA